MVLMPPADLCWIISEEKTGAVFNWCKMGKLARDGLTHPFQMHSFSAPRKLLIPEKAGDQTGSLKQLYQVNSSLKIKL